MLQQDFEFNLLSIR